MSSALVHQRDLQYSSAAQRPTGSSMSKVEEPSLHRSRREEAFHPFREVALLWPGLEPFGAHSSVAGGEGRVIELRMNGDRAS